MLIYSHDSFGLGHLRRCRSIALSLAERDPELEVLILSGQPIISSYDLHPQVRVVLVPGIIKMPNGDYRASAEGSDIETAIERRRAIILETAQNFAPHLFLVDKEPLGLRGEVRDTLLYLRSIGVPSVLGLRDVMDEPEALKAEWLRKHSIDAVENLYDEMWIYGLPQIYEPMQGIPLSAEVERRTVFTSYLHRDGPIIAGAETLPVQQPYLLITPGGGGDGEALVDWVLSAREYDPEPAMRMLIVSGPFMETAKRAAFAARAHALPNVEMLTFVPDMESLMAHASGIVAMGGYNTFCEILSFDKPALIVPRTKPRMEQYIRASRAAALGLLAMLEDDEDRTPARMAAALRRLPAQKRPSETVIPGLLDGHARIAERYAYWMDCQPAQERVAGYGD